MTKPVSIFFYSAFAILFLGILSPLALDLVKPEDALPELYRAPKFEFPEANGDSFTSKDLRGRVWVANFFFTSCEGPCPIQSTNISRLSKRFSHEPRVQFVSFSIDPTHDTLEALSEYAKRYQAAPGVWHFLRPKAEELKGILESGFRLGAPDEPMAHATRFVLVDGHGVIRGYYHGTKDESVKQLGDDIQRLLRG